MIELLYQMKNDVAAKSPLIHCLTNPISIRACANILLAIGASPIMAEHPSEVSEITAGANGLMLNLGNVTEARMRGMEQSAKTAVQHNIPMLLDLVGIGCSSMRRSFAQRLIRTYSPQILKGNRSEMEALKHHARTSRGVDAEGTATAIETAHLARELANTYGTVVLISGAADVLSDGTSCFAIYNGHPKMARLTGTGCMLGALISGFSSIASPLDAALFGTLYLGIAGELAAKEAVGVGSFEISFLDAIDTLTQNDFYHLAKAERIRI